MTTKPLTLLLAAMVASPASAQWISDGPIAVANPGAPVLVGVSFDYARACDQAHLVVYGNDDVSVMGLAVDGTSYGVVEAYRSADRMMVATLGQAALRAIKSGNTAGVSTDQGMVVVSLKGSSSALNAAYAGCMREVDAAIADFMKPIQPTQQAEQAAGFVTF